MKQLAGLSGRHALAALALVAMSTAAPVVCAQSLDPATSAAIDAALAGPHRSEQNKARDRYRHPKETLAFFGLRRDMTVVEIWPGPGWYTEVLAPVLKDHGKLYVAQYGPHAIADYQHKEDAGLLAKARQHPAVFGAVQFTTLWTPDDLTIAPPGTADLVVTFRNVHNWVNAQYKLDAPKMFGAFYTALKPGGILGVVDHHWPDAKTEDPNARYGYVSEERVIALARGAGFEFVGRSDVNRNPQDDHNHPNGVWNLPPDAQVKAGEDRQKYEAIGESDRMTLKFRKPAAK
jgi:predicted methyltransferase